MRILTVNCGSSSLKLALCDVTTSDVRRISTVSVDAIGGDATISSHGGASRDGSRRPAVAAGHRAALDSSLDSLGSDHGLSVEAIGHRVVQGGRYVSPSVIDEPVTRAIREALPLAPLHNAPSLAGIEAAAARFPGTPMVAVFDSAFHATIPEVARRYALPEDIPLPGGIRRHGYHGIAHRSLVERYAAITREDPAGVTLVTLQLGSGCSAAAVRGGVSVDTSMGFTPLEGLVMGTRPGDVDPGALLYLLREGHITPEKLDVLLNHRSGLLALSGTTSDMSELLRLAAAGDERADIAIEVFCYRVRKYIGAYVAVLGNARAVVFGGGIARSPEIRRRICERLGVFGVTFDAAKNEALRDTEGALSAANGRMEAWFIPTDEERVIARDTFTVLAGGAKPAAPGGDQTRQEARR